MRVVLPLLSVVVAGLLGAGCSGRRVVTGAPVAMAEPVLAPLAKCGIVFARGAAGAWDAGMVESPFVWFDGARGRYAMVYTGYGLKPGATAADGYRGVTAPAIGLAWSGDGVRWTRDPATVAAPLLGGSGLPGTPDEVGLTGATVVLRDGLYHLFAIGVTSAGYEGGRKTLALAISPDLRTWTRTPRPLIEPSGDGWRRDAIWHRAIVPTATGYVMFFNASGVVGGVEEERIGLATSPDLRMWTVDDARSPVLAGSGTPGAWDSHIRAGDPSVLRLPDGRWLMAYYSWDRRHAQDGYAWTTAAEFPVGWRVFAGNPVVRVGAPGAFDAQHAHKPFLIEIGGERFHYYTAVDSAETREIALAATGTVCR